MKTTTILIGLMMAGTAMPAAASDLNKLMTRPGTPSILYVGFNAVDAAGKPICTDCKTTVSAENKLRMELQADGGMPTVMSPDTQAAKADDTTAAPGQAHAETKEADAAPQQLTTASIPTKSSQPAAQSGAPASGLGVMRGLLR